MRANFHHIIIFGAKATTEKRGTPFKSPDSQKLRDFRHNFAGDTRHNGFVGTQRLCLASIATTFWLSTPNATTLASMSPLSRWDKNESMPSAAACALARRAHRDTHCASKWSSETNERVCVQLFLSSPANASARIIYSVIVAQPVHASVFGTFFFRRRHPRTYSFGIWLYQGNIWFDVVCVAMTKFNFNSLRCAQPIDGSVKKLIGDTFFAYTHNQVTLHSIACCVKSQQPGRAGSQPLNLCKTCSRVARIFGPFNRVNCLAEEWGR